MRSKLGRGSRRLDPRELGLIALSALVLGGLWYTPLAFPLRFFSILVHECSHAIACVLTGGYVDRIQLNQTGESVTFTHGGNPVAVSSAGYLGSVLFGCVCLYLSRFTRFTRYWCLAIGILLAGMTLSLVSLFGDLFGFVYGITAGLTIGLVGWRFDKLSPYFLKFIGVAVCLFAFMDIQYNLLRGSEVLAQSDAGILQRATGIPDILSAVCWIVIAVVTFLYFGYLSATTLEDAVVSGGTRTFKRQTMIR